LISFCQEAQSQGNTQNRLFPKSYFTVQQQTKMTTVFDDCQGGYWSSYHETTLAGEEDVLACKPVGPGYYSPNNDSVRYACPPGTFSNTDTATECMECAPGTYSDAPRATECSLCPTKTYTTETKSEKCQPCNGLYYEGLASDYAIFLSAQQTGQATDDLYCIEPLNGPVYLEPTPSPTMAPTTTTHETDTPIRAPTVSPTKITTTTTATEMPPIATGQAVPTFAPTTFMTPTTTSVKTWEPTVSPSLPAGLAPLQDVPVPATGTPEQVWNTNSVSNIWLPIACGIGLALAMGLAVLWSSSSTSPKSLTDEESGDCSSSSHDGSTSSVFADEVASTPSYVSDVESLALPSSAVSGVWSTSVGLRFPHNDDESEESSDCESFGDILST